MVAIKSQTAVAPQSTTSAVPNITSGAPLPGRIIIAAANDLYWDANGAAAGVGGTGMWHTANTWRSGGTGGALQSWADGNTATFTSTAGTVTVDSAVSAFNLVFSQPLGGYTIDGSSILTLTSNSTAAGSQAIVTNSVGTTSITAPVNLGQASGSATFSVGSGTTLNIGGQITSTNTVGINKTATGTLILGGNNSYTGDNTFTAGTVLVNNTNTTTGSGTGSGTVTLSNAGTLLGGTGRISGAVSLGTNTQITGATNGTVGTLTLGSSATFNGTSAYLVDLSGATSDKLAITGALNLGSATDQITFNGTADGTSNYVLATYGSETGTFNTVNNMPANYVLIYGANELDLVAVPEPSTWAAGLLMVAALAFSQRRRLRELLKPAA